MIPLKLIQKTELKALLKASDRKYVCQPCPSRGFVALDAKSHQVPPTPLPEHASDESITPTSDGEARLKSQKKRSQMKSPSQKSQAQRLQMKSPSLKSQAQRLQMKSPSLKNSELKARYDHAETIAQHRP